MTNHFYQNVCTREIVPDETHTRHEQHTRTATRRGLECLFDISSLGRRFIAIKLQHLDFVKQ